MSPAISDVTRDMTPEQRKERGRARYQSRRAAEVKRRVVVNLPDEFGWYIKEHLAEWEFETIPSALRVLTMEALRARGITLLKMKAEYTAYLAKQAMDEAAANLAAAEAEVL